MKSLSEFINESLVYEGVDLNDPDVKLLLEYFNVSPNRIKRNSSGKLIVTGNCETKKSNSEEIEDLTKFNLEEVHGNFSLWNCPKLSSLEGCPKLIKNCFSIYNLNIESLNGGPQFVLGQGRKKGYQEIFYIEGCQKLNSLEGAPAEINGSIILQNNRNLKSLKYLPKCYRVVCFNLNYKDNKEYIDGASAEMKDGRFKDGLSF